MAGTSPAMTSYVVGIAISDIAMNDSQSLAQIKTTIVLAGAGKMGGAMLSGWLAQGLDAKHVVVIEPYPSDEISALVTKGVGLNPSPKKIGAVATLVIALKPQTFSEAGAVLKSFVGSSTLAVSIMAGTTIASISEVCGGSVVRAMPNTPAAIGRGKQRQRGTARGRRRAAARHRIGGMGR